MSHRTTHFSTDLPTSAPRYAHERDYRRSHQPIRRLRRTPSPQSLYHMFLGYQTQSPGSALLSLQEKSTMPSTASPFCTGGSGVRPLKVCPLLPHSLPKAASRPRTRMDLDPRGLRDVCDFRPPIQTYGMALWRQRVRCIVEVGRLHRSRACFLCHNPALVGPLRRWIASRSKQQTCDLEGRRRSRARYRAVAAAARAAQTRYALCSSTAPTTEHASSTDDANRRLVSTKLGRLAGAVTKENGHGQR